MNEAVGIIEMFGFVTAIAAADAAAKAADVKIVAIDTNKPANADAVEVPLITAVKIAGEVSAVRAAVAAGAAKAEEIAGVINTHVISRPTDDAVKMSRRVSVGRDRVGHIKNNS